MIWIVIIIAIVAFVLYRKSKSDSNSTRQQMPDFFTPMEQTKSDAKKTYAPIIGNPKPKLSTDATTNNEYYYKAVECKRAKDYDGVIQYWTKAAESGDAVAQRDLAGLYNTLSDYPKAVYWYQKLADQGYADAQDMLGNFYMSGVVNDQENPRKAILWYEKAAKQGYTSAQSSLAMCYEEGKGVPKDTSKAIYWFERVAGDVDGDPEERCYAQAILGFIYADQNNMVKAVSCWQKAAEIDFEGDKRAQSDAQCALGFAYLSGDVVKKNKEVAKFWLECAVSCGHEKAKELLTQNF